MFIIDLHSETGCHATCDKLLISVPLGWDHSVVIYTVYTEYGFLSVHRKLPCAIELHQRFRESSKEEIS